MSRVVLLAIDAAEPRIVQRGIDEGWLPSIAALLKRGRGVELRSMIALHGSVWIDAYTGTLPHQHLSAGSVQLEPGSYRLSTPAPERRAHRPLWKHASDAGLDSIVMDAYGAGLVHSLRGIQVQGWGAMQDPYVVASGGPRSAPPDILRRLERSLGRSVREPVEALNSPASFRRFGQRLLDWVARRRLAIEDLWAEPWQLFAATFGEIHLFGHLAWHLHDVSHPAHDPAWDPDLKELHRRLYEAVDAAVGRIVDRCTEDDTVFILTPHGMTSSGITGDPLPEILRRGGWLRRLTASGAPGPSMTARVKAVARGVLPGTAHAMIRKAVRRVRPAPTPQLSGIDWSRTAAFALPWAWTSHLRLNLIGREPRGTVRPGEEADALVDEISALLGRLVDDAGGPAVDRITRIDEALGAPVGPVLPDLAIEWADRPLRRIRAEPVGTIEVPMQTRRTGSHSERGFVIAAGPGIIPAASPELRTPAVSPVDLAPTVLSALGVPVPEELAGSPIDGLTPTR